VTGESAEQIAQLALLGEAVEQLQAVAIFVWDDDRNYVAANQAACDLLGRTRAELLTMKVGDMTPNRAAPYFDEVQQHGAVHTGSLRVPRAGDPVDIDWMTCRTRIAGLPYMVSVCWRKEPA
jgi:PAS domain-containing protein